MTDSELFRLYQQVRAGVPLTQEELEDVAADLWSRGSMLALTVFWTDQMPRLYRFAYRLLGNRQDAEDVVSEAMELLLKRRPDDPQRLVGWLCMVVTNLCKNEWRKRGRRRRLDEENPPDPADATVEPNLMMGSLRSLPPEVEETMRRIRAIIGPENLEFLHFVEQHRMGSKISWQAVVERRGRAETEDSLKKRYYRIIRRIRDEAPPRA